MLIHALLVGIAAGVVAILILIIINARRMIAMFATLEEFMSAIDAETTRIGTVVNELKEAAESGRWSADDSAKAEALVSRLQAIGADAENPIPPEEPTPEEPAEG